MTTRDVIIIGGGPAGLTAALYTGRASLKPLLLEGEPVSPGDLPGGQLMNTTEIENFPGAPGLQGPELMAKMREQAGSFGAEIIGRRATKVDLSTRPFKVWAGDDEYAARTLIIATGAHALTLGLPREWELMGRGVSSCATCDGFFFKDQDIAVVGGGDSAMEEATFLTKFAKSVTIIHRRDSLRASVIMQDRAKANPKIKFLWNTEATGILGQDKVAGLTIKNNLTGATSELGVTGLFYAIGHQPNSELFAGQLEFEHDHYIKVSGAATNVPGVFAAGDVADRLYRQAVTSAGTGCMAALDAQHFLEAHPEPAPAKATALSS